MMADKEPVMGIDPKTALGLSVPSNGAHNRIYYYSEVTRESILTLNKDLKRTSQSLLTHQINNESDNPDKIFLHINSFGGSLFSGIAGMDQILTINKKVEIVTIIDGCAASAATFLSVVGSHRQINEHSYMLIHELSSKVWGQYREFKDAIKNLDSHMDMMRDLYKQYTKIPAKTLKELLTHDIWFDAKECLKLGLVDEII